MILLAAGFLLTALIYAMVGFGGGSTYTALLVLAGTDYRAVPVISLLCNVLVVTFGAIAFARAGHFDARRSWPLFVLSVPAAALGGHLPVGETLFLGLLAQRGGPHPKPQSLDRAARRWTARLRRGGGRHRRRHFPRPPAPHPALGS